MRSLSFIPQIPGKCRTRYLVSYKEMNLQTIRGRRPPPESSCPPLFIAPSSTAAMHERALDHLSSADRTLARLIQRVGPCRMRADRKCPPFESLVRAVAHQQLTGKAANTILGRLIALHPHRDFPAPDDLLATTDDQLRGVGFSRAKVASLKDIAARTVEGVVPETKALGKDRKSVV